MFTIFRLLLDVELLDQKQALTGSIFFNIEKRPGIKKRENYFICSKLFQKGQMATMLS